MFAPIGNSFRLFRTTLHVLSHDKELLVFPLVSGIASVVLLLSFGAGMYGSGLFDAVIERADRDDGAISGAEIAATLLLLLFHFVNFFIMTYFNSALIGAAYIRLGGGDPTVADGFAAANQRLGAILGYSMIAATVGLILQALQNQSRNNVLGRIVIGLIGMAWTLITYLVVPVLVIERVGPIEAIRRSTRLLKESWGEQIVANFGFGLLGFLLMLPGVAAVGIAGWYTASQGGSAAVLIATIACAVLYWVLLAIVLTALRGIYTAALYCYATNQEPRGFPVELLAEGFSPRQGT